MTGNTTMESQPQPLGLSRLTGQPDEQAAPTVPPQPTEAAPPEELTGEQKVHAVIGGFHLSGPLFEPIIAPTVAALKELDPALVVPAHCTGWKAVHAIARELPQAFVQNSVGTRFVLSQ